MNSYSYIPLYSAFLGALIGLITAFIGYYFSNKQLTKRLEFEAQETEKDRVHKLRKDIYMNSIVELSNANISIGIFISKRLDGDEVNTTMRSFAGTLESLQVISELELSSLARHVSQSYASIFIDLMVELKPINVLDCHIEVNQKIISEEQNKTKTFLEILKQTYSEKTYNIVDESIRKQRDLGAENELFANQISSLREELARKIMTRIQDLQPILNKLKVNLRKEIYGSEKIDLYETDLNNATQVDIDKVLDKISKTFN